MPKIQAWKASDGSLHEERAEYQQHEIELMLKHLETRDNGPEARKFIKDTGEAIVANAKAVVALLTLTETSRPGGRKALRKNATDKAAERAVAKFNEVTRNPQNA
jgi:hypothetical protein